MRAIPGGSIDAIVTDPPYGQSNEGYDSPIAFGPEVWRECHRVAKPNAALVAFAGSPTYHRIATAIEDAGWTVRQMWGWVYRSGFITSAWPKEGFDRLAPAMDPIVFATKGKVLLNLEREGAAWSINPKTRGQQTYSVRASSHGRTEAKGHWPRSLMSDGVEPFEYFDVTRIGAKAAHNSTHSNEKPLRLMRKIIGKLPGQTVLDPFAGSGATLRAAYTLGRDSVGIEQDHHYYAAFHDRLAELNDTAS